MGPTGRHVVLQKSFGGPAVTKDGVSVARELNSPTHSRTWAPRWCTRWQKTADVAGDGTAATVLARYLEQGLKQVATGANAIFPSSVVWWPPPKWPALWTNSPSHARRWMIFRRWPRFPPTTIVNWVA